MKGLGRLVGLVVLLVACVAHGGEVDTTARAEAREHYKKGSVAYELGHYDTAITEYEACYALVSDPALLWNLGQAHRQLHHDAEALRFYQLFLQKVPRTAYRSEAEAKIVALEASIAEQASHPQPAPQPPREEPVVVAPQPVQEVEAYHPPAAPDHSRRRRVVAGLTLGIVGLGLVAGGIATAVLGQHASDEISHANDVHGAYSPSEYSTWKTDRIVSGVLLGVGGAALVTGVTLGVLGARRGHERAMAWQVVPTLSPTQAGVTVMKRF